MIDLPLHLLPPKLREIAEYCGIETALLLIEHAGGQYVKVPSPDYLFSGHFLVEWLGVDRAQAFCRIYQGDSIQIAKADAAKRIIRNQQIQTERRSGATLSSLARRHNLTMRQITNIVGAEANDGQFDLFGLEP